MVIESFEFGSGWISEIMAFEILAQSGKLLYLTRHGFSLFDTKKPCVHRKVDFGELHWYSSGCALSPRAPLLAVCFSERGPEGLLDGECRYKNFVRIYSLLSGDVEGEQLLPGEGSTNWKVVFGADGCSLRCTSKESTEVFELSAER
jgi:hypothetical protein